MKGTYKIEAQSKDENRRMEKDKTEEYQNSCCSIYSYIHCGQINSKAKRITRDKSDQYLLGNGLLC